MVHVDTQAYLCRPKGPLDSYHSIIAPVGHVCSMEEVAADAALSESVDRLKALFCELAAQADMSALFVEKQIRMSSPTHSIIECYGIRSVDVQKFFSKLRAEGDSIGVEFVDVADEGTVLVTSARKLSAHSDPRELFCGVSVFGKDEIGLQVQQGLVHVIKRGDGAYAPLKLFPVQFVRMLLAHVNNCPERGAWRDCVENHGEEIRGVTWLKAKLTPHLPAADEEEDFSISEDEEGDAENEVSEQVVADDKPAGGDSQDGVEEAGASSASGRATTEC